MPSETAFAEMTALLPARPHPEAEEVENDTVAWADRAQLPMDKAKFERLRGSRIGHGVANCSPDLPRELVSLWARFTFWYTAFDDVCAEDVAARDLSTYIREAGQIWRILHDETPPEPPRSKFAAALQPLLAELDNSASATTANRLRHALRDYLMAAAWEANSRSSNVPPHYDDYLSFYRHSGTFVLNIEFLETTPGAALSDEARRLPHTRAMRAALCDMGCLVNFISSGPKEKELNTSWPTAFTADIGAVYTARCLDLARTVAELRDTYAVDPEVGGFFMAGADWAAGMVRWHQESLAHRYSLGPGNLGAP
ncbi:hypothetical protein [Nocardia sp. NPDC049149]|uniref:terpene synthase family protein n=1 Tax=Nocardia sp. NPDC049149 TaxID=3364315 RepID=UPI003713211D